MALSESLKCIVIARADLHRLFQECLKPENLSLIRGKISQEKVSINLLKKAARYFSEKKLPPGSYIIEEGKAVSSIYILKKGTCEVFMKENPLLKREPGEEEFFLRSPVTGQDYCLGLNQGSMSKAFSYFPIKTIGAG